MLKISRLKECVGQKLSAMLYGHRDKWLLLRFENGQMAQLCIYAGHDVGDDELDEDLDFDRECYNDADLLQRGFMTQAELEADEARAAQQRQASDAAAMERRRRMYLDLKAEFEP